MLPHLSDFLGLAVAVDRSVFLGHLIGVRRRLEFWPIEGAQVGGGGGDGFPSSVLSLAVLVPYNIAVAFFNFWFLAEVMSK